MKNRIILLVFMIFFMGAMGVIDSSLKSVNIAALDLESINSKVSNYDVNNSYILGLASNNQAQILSFDYMKNELEKVANLSNEYTDCKVYQNKYLYSQGTEKDELFLVSPNKRLLKIQEFSAFYDILDFNNSNILMFNYETNMLELYSINESKLEKKFDIYIENDSSKVSGVIQGNEQKLLMIHGLNGETYCNTFNFQGQQLSNDKIFNQGSVLTIRNIKDRIFILLTAYKKIEGIEPQSTIYEFVDNKIKEVAQAPDECPVDIIYNSTMKRYIVISGNNTCDVEVYDDNFKILDKVSLSNIESGQFLSMDSFEDRVILLFNNGEVLSVDLNDINNISCFVSSF